VSLRELLLVILSSKLLDRKTAFNNRLVQLAKFVCETVISSS